jgi:hypothetical protein
MAKPLKKTDLNRPWYLKKTKRQPYQTESDDKEKTFLIICEGQNTEPEYFKAFPVKTADVHSYGLGSSKMALVEYVVTIVKTENDKDTENWVVFDMDIKPDEEITQKEDYENAIRLAENKGIHVAFANDAFELWFLLHYQYFDNQWTRHQYYERLSKLWNCNYEKEGKKIAFCKQIYQRLLQDENASQEEAIKRSKKLLEDQKNIRLADKNPATSIHILVEELNKYI